MSGEAFTKPTDDEDKGPDVETFNVRQWIKGTALVTRSVTVCGMPHLMGAIEDLKDQLERAQATEFDDERPLARSTAMRLAEELEAARAQMFDSMVTFRFRGLRPGEYEKIRAEVGEDVPDEDYQYHLYAAVCVKPEGLTWEDFKAMHVGDDEAGIEGLGAYFLHTIGRKATQAIEGTGVDVPFSSASSSLTATSSKN
jgi:hypothetical protein